MFSSFTHLLALHRRSLLLALLLLVLESLVGLAIPWFAARFSAALLQQRFPFDLNLLQISLLWLVLFALQAALRFLAADRTNAVGISLLTRLSCMAYDHIQILPMSYFLATRKGETLSLLTNDIAIISHFLSGVITSFVPALLLVGGSALMMLSIDLQISVMILVTVPLFAIALRLMGRTIGPLSEKILQKQADSVALASGNFATIKLIKAFNRESLESARFRATAAELGELRRRMLRAQALLSPAMQLLVSSHVLIVVMFAASHYQAGELAIPDMIALLMYGFVFARTISGLAQSYGQTQQFLAASRHLEKMMSLHVEPVMDGDATVRIGGNIRFECVSFAYPGGTAVLQDLNLAIAPGEKVVLLGSNGRGKTTLLHLIMRYIEPSQGRITLDGRALAEINVHCLRNQIGLVSQDVALCDGSVLDNVAYGHPQASSRAIHEAIRMTGVDAMTANMAQGLLTPVGEDGVRLSGGQRQRIALARALLASPAILLLDEPTSMFDAQGKENFREKFSEICGGRTVLIATHDAKLVAVADRAIRL